MKIPLLNWKREKNDGPTVRYEDGMLFIDCRKCAGISSLGDAECVKCVSKNIADIGPPMRLMMRKENDIEYSENVISVINDISRISSLITAASSENIPARCRDCPCSMPKNAKDIWDSFPEPRFDIMRLEAERSVPEKEGCEECMWRTIGLIDQAESMFSDVRRKSAKIAFSLTEV